jgi:hypothetical protein
MTCTLRWVGTEVREPTTVYVQNDLEEFFKKFELEVIEIQRLQVLDIALKDTPEHWWGTHKDKIQNCYQCKRLLCIIFDTKQEKRYVEKYDGMGQPKEHVEICITQWILVPP